MIIMILVHKSFDIDVSISHSKEMEMMNYGQCQICFVINLVKIENSLQEVNIKKEFAISTVKGKKKNQPIFSNAFCF